MTTATITQLKREHAKLNCGEFDFDDCRPNEADNEGMLSLWLDADYRKQFTASNATVLCAPYWSDAPGSRAQAIASLIEDVKLGLEPMSEDTAHACGIEI